VADSGSEWDSESGNRSGREVVVLIVIVGTVVPVAVDAVGKVFFDCGWSLLETSENEIKVRGEKLDHPKIQT
jgi:hypothetical protein